MMSRRNFAIGPGRRALVLLALGTGLAVSPATTLRTALASAPPAGACGAQESSAATRSADLRQRNLESFDLVWKIIRDRHYDPELGGVDWEAARQKFRPLVEQAKTLEEARAHTQAMIDLLGQSHMALIPGSAMQAITGEDDRQPATQPVPQTRAAPRAADAEDDENGAAATQPARPGGERAGEGQDGDAGFTLRLADTASGMVLVTSVRPGSSSEAAGIRPGWQVVRIDGREVAPLVAQITQGISQRGHGKPELYVSMALQGRLRGEVGDELEAVFIDGDGKEQVTRIAFGPSTEESVTLGLLPPLPVDFESRRISRDGVTLGYIRFTAFLDPPKLAPQFEAAMRDFTDEANPVDGVVLDVRGNIGGIVSMVPGIAGYFISERGVNMGTLRTRQSELKLVVFPRLIQYAGPLAVLTDACSASAAELLAGGLKGVGRARVFGVATAGEALPAQFIRLPNGDTFLFVFSDYTTADGQRLEGDGVVPDEPVAYDRASLLAGEDPMLSAAASWIGSQKADPSKPGR